MKMNSRSVSSEFPICKVSDRNRSTDLPITSQDLQNTESIDVSSKGFSFVTFKESSNMNANDYYESNLRHHQTTSSKPFFDRNGEHAENAIPNDAWYVSVSPTRDEDETIKKKKEDCNCSSSSSSDNNNQDSDKQRNQEHLTNSLRHTKLQSLNYKLSEKMTVVVGILLIAFILILHTLFAWLIQTMYTYDSQTFGWKIALDMFFMSIKTSSSGCTLHSKKVQIAKIAECVREDVFMNCPYVIEFSGTLLVFLFVLGMSVFNVLLALMFLTSRKIRELCGTGGQYFIKSLTIICCWLGLWLSVPIIINFYFCFVKLKDAMKETINIMNPPEFISQWWDQTQTSSQCCGISFYLDWETRNGTYPTSCCNTKNNDCKSLPTEKEVWPYGCYDQEYKRLQFFGGLFVAFWILKLIGEIVLYFILCHVFENYSTPKEKKLRSSIRVHGYKIKLHGNMDIQSVPNQSKVVVELLNDVVISEDCRFTTKATRKGLLVLLTDIQSGSLIGYAQITAAKGTNIKNVTVSGGRENNCFNLILS